MSHSDIKNEHHTEMYNFDTPVFRRGIPFSLSVYSGESREIIDGYSYSLELEGEHGMTIRLMKDREVSGWKYEIGEHTGSDKFRINLQPSTTTAIGLYVLHVINKGRVIMRKKFLILFNPWNTDDTVYMDDEKLLEEYVLSTNTIIYVGSKYSISQRRWKLDQFDKDSIRATLSLLSRMSYQERKDPVYVSRSLSALVNSNDDNGVLAGNWSGEYEGGTNPSYWTRSGDILSEFVNTNRPVRYGQCWVFSAVLCTVLRTIGIPTRCITCFASFHDADATLNWEVYVDENLNAIDKGSDSCWNFHCWNESWMKRNDLDSQFNGWQVLDATPQERSRGLFRLGPAPKYAIKNAITDKRFDVGFVFAEVSAQKIYYMRQPDGNFKKYKVEKDLVGKKISTKMVGVDRREDITLEYKQRSLTVENPPETPRVEGGSEPEPVRNKNIAIGFSVPTQICLTDGLNATINVTGMNDGKETKVRRQLSLISYHGKLITELFDEQTTFTQTTATLELKTDSNTLSRLVQVEFPSIRCRVTVYDPEFDEFISKEKIIAIMTPDIEIIKLRKLYFLHSTIKMKVSIKNNLDKPLTNLSLKVDFTDYNPPLIYVGALEPNNTVILNVILNPQSYGMKKVTVGQVSKECSGFSCTQSFLVLP